MAERSIIDTMAQKLHEDRRARDGFFIPWSECHPSHHKATREDVVSILRSLIDAGPTGAMVTAGQIAMRTDDLDPTPDEVRAGISASLRAALEEADNHG